MTNHSPLLTSRFVLLPLYGSLHTVDFWSEIYAMPDGTNEKALSQFPKCASDEMARFGYHGTTDGLPRLMSLSKGFVGIGRKMLVYRNHRAGALLYFKFLEDACYVSLRVVYYQPFSLLKILRFVLVALIFTLFAMAVNSFSLTPVSAGYGETQYLIDSSPIHIGEGIMAGVFISAFVFITWGMWSWWWTGRFLNFLRENFDELYRDDLASIGHAAYSAILKAADSLSLTTLNPQEQTTPPPAFGMGTLPNPTRRPRRI